MSDEELAHVLGTLFAKIKEHEKDYDVRERLVYKALSTAKILGYKSGIRFDAADPTWPVVCITLPDKGGEVSWHCPPYDVPFVEYTTDEKYKRCEDYIALHCTNKTFGFYFLAIPYFFSKSLARILFLSSSRGVGFGSIMMLFRTLRAGSSRSEVSTRTGR